MKYFIPILILVFLSSCVCSKKTSNSTRSVIAENKVPQSVTSPEKLPQNKPKDSITKTLQIAVDPNVSDTTQTIRSIAAKENITVFDHSSWTILLTRYVSEQGNVDYKGVKSNYKDLSKYLSLLSKNPPTNSWSREDKLAFWINAYNAFTVKLIVDNYPLKSIKDIKTPWDYRFIKIGPKWYTLNDIEHRILRKMDEPRIHFAINCASVSCPKLLNEAFLPEKLDSQLTSATQEFLSDPVRNEIGSKKVKISKIFRWFGKDFKGDGSLLDFLNKYTDISISPTAKMSFKEYNWNLNE